MGHFIFLYLPSMQWMQIGKLHLVKRSSHILENVSSVGNGICCNCKISHIAWFLVIVQLDAQILFSVFIYSSLHVSSMSCSSSGETDCFNTASGNCHSVLVMTLPPTRSDNYQNLYWYSLFLLMMSMTCSKLVENYK